MQHKEVEINRTNISLIITHSSFLFLFIEKFVTFRMKAKSIDVSNLNDFLPLHSKHQS